LAIFFLFSFLLFFQFKFAVKCLKKSSLADKDNIERALREILIVKLLKHPHIATLFDVIDTQTEIYMIFEYASGGELFDYIVSHRRVKEKEAKKLFLQIISALHYCHSHSIIHRFHFSSIPGFLFFSFSFSFTFTLPLLC